MCNSRSSERPAKSHTSSWTLSGERDRFWLKTLGSDFLGILDLRFVNMIFICD